MADPTIADIEDVLATAERGHRRAVDGDFSGIVGFLHELFGAKLVAHMAGVKDEKRVHKWINGSRASTVTERRLRDAFQIAWLLTDFDNDRPETVRAWFIGMNPQLEFTAPANLIRDDRASEVMAAAKDYLHGG